jgi:hypothetical protein
MKAPSKSLRCIRRCERKPGLLADASWIRPLKAKLRVDVVGEAGSLLPLSEGTVIVHGQLNTTANNSKSCDFKNQTTAKVET